MLLAEYEKEGRDTYGRFAQAIAGILRAALQPLSNIQVQQIQHRAKDLKSLRKKVADRGIGDEVPIDGKIKDLAGCRVVLYTNSDVARFERENIIPTNFEIDWQLTKVHYPVPGTDSADLPFISRNYVVRLKEDRVSLPEYAEFAGLLCEIQVQTSLNHAWAETEHNIIYKSPELVDFGTAAMADIKQRLNRIANDYLRPAGDEFQRVRADFEQLLAGKELLDRNILRQLAESHDNAERMQLLDEFADKVIPNYDDIANVYGDIRDAVLKMLRATLSEGQVTTLPRAEHVVDRAASILERLHFISVEQAFDDYSEMYLLSPSGVIRRRWVQAVRRLAEHNLEVWKKAGPIVQQLLVEHLLGLGQEKLLGISHLAFETLHSVLDTQVSGTEMMTFESIKISRGSVVWSQALQDVRHRALGLLEQLLLSVVSDAERQYAVNAITETWRLAFVGRPSPDLIAGMLRDARKVIDVLRRGLSICNYLLREHIEHKLWYLRYYARNLPHEFHKDESVKAELAALFSSIETLQIEINADKDFLMFKTLYGHEAIFPSQWAADDFDHELQRAYRVEAFNNSVAGITQENIEQWRERLLLYSGIRSGDGADPIPFYEFLRTLGSAKPVLSMWLAERMDGDLSRYSPALLEGIDRDSSFSARLRSLIETWIAGAIHLREVAFFLECARIDHLSLLQPAMERAIATDDSGAVRALIEVFTRRFADLGKDTLRLSLLPGITFLTAHNDFGWTDSLWMAPNAKTFYGAFEETDVKNTLANLVHKPEISDADSRLLARFAARQPRLLIEFFASRVGIESAQELPEYQAIPYQLGELKQPLREHVEVVLRAMATWYAQEPSLFSFRGGRFLASIFGNAEAEIVEVLIRWIQAHGPGCAPFVVAIVHSFQGELDVTRVCRELVAVLPAGDAQLEDVEGLLFQVGGTTGEFGLVDAYKEVRRHIVEWQADAATHVRKFAQGFLHNIDQAIASEQQAAEQRLQQRKLGFR